MTKTTPVRPVPFAAELQPAIDAMAENPQPEMTRETLPHARGTEGFPTPAELVADRPVRAEERTIPGPPGAPDLEVTILTPEGRSTSDAPVPALYNIHGGGMIVGHRYWETGRLLDLVEQLGVVGVNVEYRLAPEDPYPAGVDDCYAGLEWLASHSEELGADPERIVVMGGSAGGGFSAAVALMARDRKGPAIAGQLLLCPMIDNTNTTVSSRQYSGIGTWTREANELAWNCVLGDELAASTAAPAYAAPTRATDLSNLPPAFIEAGSAEVFRDEDVDYATRIWAAGGRAELHIWSGGFHGFDMFTPDSDLAAAALDTRVSWLRRTLGLHS